MPTFDTAPADPLDYALVNAAFDGVVPGQDWSSLNALEAANVEDGKLTQRAVNVYQRGFQGQNLRGQVFQRLHSVEGGDGAHD